MSQELYPVKILLVDDDEASVSFLKLILKKYFQEVIVASNGKEGFEKYIIEKPDIVISDIAMPIMNGLEMTEKIKNLNKNAIIILQTAFDNKELLFRAIELGVTQYLIKPLNKNLLLEKLGFIVNQILLSKKLQKNEVNIKTLSSAVENASAMIVILDSAGIITFVNKMFYEVTAYTPDELIGRNFIEFLNNVEHVEIAELSKSIQNGMQFRTEAILIAKNVPEIWVSVLLSPIMDDYGEIINFSLIIDDITARIIEKKELKELNEFLEKNVSERTTQYMELNALLVEEIEIRKETEAELLKAKEIAEKANLSKSAFMAKVSHELRTPLNGIIGMTSLLLEKVVDPHQKKSLKVVSHSADTLLRLINDILDFAKLESGKLLLYETKFAFRDMINDLYELFFPLALNQGLRLNTEISDDIPQVLIGDSTRLQQAIINLVGNAIKFTKEGEILLNIEIKSQTETNLELIFSVKDTGIGIPDDKRDLLFKSFSQIEHHLTRKFGGVGLGLYITKEIVSLMHGEIWFESEVKKGSTFYFTAQLTKVKDGTEINEISFDEKCSDLTTAIGYTPRILIVDDSMINQEVFKEMLIQMKADTVSANDGFEAIEILESTVFDLLLIDAEMPGINGFEVVKYIRRSQLEYLRNLPIILITAYELYENWEEVQNLGIDAVLQKPCTKNKLYNNFVDLLKNRPRVSKNIDSGKASPIVENNLELTKLIDSINGSEKTLTRLIDYFNKNIDNSLLRLSGYIAENNKKNISAEAHKLKSELGTLGAYRAAELLKGIEEDVRANSIKTLSERMDNLITEIDFVKTFFHTHSVQKILELYKVK